MSFLILVLLFFSESGSATKPSKGAYELVDFSNATLTDDGSRECVNTTGMMEIYEKTPVYECVHKTEEQCHYTYVTQFEPTRQEECEENYEKSCQLTYRQVATNETHTHCYQPLVRKCDGEPSSKEGGKEVCKDWPETFCTTQYKQNDGGQFVADTKCERIHTELCVPENCVMVPGPEKCHEQVVPSIHEVPEENCDLIPYENCVYKTKLVPKLKAVPVCTPVPRQFCTVKYVRGEKIRKEILSIWCRLIDQETTDEELQTTTETNSEFMTTTMEELVVDYDAEIPEITTDGNYDYDLPLYFPPPEGNYLTSKPLLETTTSMGYYPIKELNNAVADNVNPMEEDLPSYFPVTQGTEMSEGISSTTFSPDEGTADSITMTDVFHGEEETGTTFMPDMLQSLKNESLMEAEKPVEAYLPPLEELAPVSGYLPPVEESVSPAESYLPPLIDDAQKPVEGYLPPVEDLESEKPVEGYLPPVVESEKTEESYLPPVIDGEKPSETYLPPIMESEKPAESYLPPVIEEEKPAEEYLPPVLEDGKPAESYLPPVIEDEKPVEGYLPPVIENAEKPVESYLPPVVEAEKPVEGYLPPTIETAEKPAASYLPPVIEDEKPAASYLPPVIEDEKPIESYLPPIVESEKPVESYLPPNVASVNPTQDYLSPSALETDKPSVSYSPPNTGSSKPTIEYLPPLAEASELPSYSQKPVTDYLPPKEPPTVTYSHPYDYSPPANTESEELAHNYLSGGPSSTISSNYQKPVIEYLPPLTEVESNQESVSNSHKEENTIAYLPPFESMKLPLQEGYGAPLESVLNGNDLPLVYLPPSSTTTEETATLDSIPPSNGYLPSSPSSNSAFPANGFSNANPDEQAGEIDNLSSHYSSNVNADALPNYHHHVSKSPQRPSHYYSAVTQNLPRYMKKRKSPHPQKDLRSYKQRVGASYLPTPNELVEQSESYRPIFREQFAFPKGPKQNKQRRARRRNGRVPGYLALLADFF